MQTKKNVNILLFPIIVSLGMTLLLSLPVQLAAATDNSPLSIAFYYATRPPLNELQAFDIVVVDPDAVGIAPQAYKSNHSELFAYISIGEADPARSHFKQIKPEWLIGENPSWKSKLVDLANPAWRNFFLDQVVEPLWQAGYRGFFLDTLDSYQLVTDKKRHPALTSGLVEIIRGIKQRHPEARLILNRGFEVLDRVKDVAFAVAAESLFQNFDPATGAYGDVNETDRQWLLARFTEVRKAGLPVIAIEYVAPKDRNLARKTAEKVKALGFTPWVTDKDLASLGIGTVEVLPRRILGLYDGSEGPDPIYSNLQRFAVMPLNYLGYVTELHDLQKPLPSGILKGRYAGILVWPNADSSGDRQNLLPWLVRQKEDGVPLLFLDRFGVPPQQFAKAMGGSLGSFPASGTKLTILTQAPMVGFEKKITLPRDQVIPLRFDQSEPLLTLGNSSRGVISESIALTPWGGYALSPFVVNELIDERSHWIFDPFTFFSKALRLDGLPAADTTTENGVRLLLSHIDADGFESRVERPGGPLAVTELRERILKKYRIPTTYSVITSTLGDHGLNPKQAPVLQAEAREIFRLPWIEVGSHTFSHPFYWKETEVTRRDYTAQYLPLPGYQFNLEAEIPGSIRFIEQQLVPPGKKVRLLQWTGNCLPDAAAVALCYRSGVGNINGGDTKITETNRSMTAIAPLGVFRDGWFQVFAPNQNENVYTNDWTGPFYGYRRVIETFRLTDTPRRLKPINIYYHTYSVTKEAGRRALEDVYNWVLARNPHAIYTSDYVDKVLDFNRTVVARSGAGWLIRNRSDLRQLRLPISAGYPDLAASRGVIGFSDHNDQRYIHLAPGGEALLTVTDTAPKRPWLAAATGRTDSFSWTATGMKLTITAHTDGYIRFDGAAGCKLLSHGRPLNAKHEQGTLTAQLIAGTRGLELVCP